MTLTVLTQPDLPQQDADVAGLIALWDEAQSAFVAAVRQAGPDAWDLPTPCPGWSVGDLVAHVTSIERLLLRHRDPPHEPDWQALPHVAGDFGRLTEVPVDLRRRRTRSDVLAEFQDTVTARRRQLVDGPQDLEADVDSMFGGTAPLDRVLRTRIFDIWVHEQDVRIATGQPGHLATPPAWIAAGRMVGALGYVWARKADAPIGATLRMVSPGPGVSFSVDVARMENGKGALVAPVAEPTTTVTLAWPEFVGFACGRIPADLGPELATISGDEDLGRAVVTNLTVTP